MKHRLGNIATQQSDFNQAATHPPLRLERVQPSMQARSSRMESELPWSSNSFTSAGRAGRELWSSQL